VRPSQPVTVVARNSEFTIASSVASTTARKSALSASPRRVSRVWVLFSYSCGTRRPGAVENAIT
jgi:hypothetical protein